MRKVNSVEDAIKYLEEASLSIEEIRTERPIEVLLDSFARERALKSAEDRFVKWYSKRGKDCSEPVLRKASYGFIRKTMLEELYRIILGYWGIAGGLTLDYTSLGYKVSKQYHKNRGNALLNVVKGLIEMHNVRFRLDETKLKTIALATIKLERWLEKEYSNVVFKVEEEKKVLGSDRAENVID